MTLDEVAAELAALREAILAAHPPEVLNTEEAAAIIGVKADTMRIWRKDAFGPKYSQPNARVVRYLRKDVIAWLEEHRSG
jgi:hypothetical protein